ncbi:uncharacterized protein LOC121405595 [Lytechinus variegatus]|uniref:uncharacterized protein LOC121405595 n=1 Tax=Lytechinus variegatus TaxID=7654 RepID=UPI001BB1ADC1|nr:uncharacterized protein LOC121405595 [Lytechinus variegatus]
MDVVDDDQEDDEVSNGDAQLLGVSDNGKGIPMVLDPPSIQGTSQIPAAVQPSFVAVNLLVPASQSSKASTVFTPIQPAPSPSTPTLMRIQLAPQTSHSKLKPILPASSAAGPNSMTTEPATIYRKSRASPVIPKSTLYYRKRRAQEKAEGKGIKTYKPRTRLPICSQCERERDRKSHTQFYGRWYCAQTDTRSYKEWRAMMAELRAKKKKLK